jgi:hypothetical protein
MRMHPDVSPASWHKTPSDPHSSHYVHRAADFDRKARRHRDRKHRSQTVNTDIEILLVHVEIALNVLVNLVA